MREPFQGPASSPRARAYNVEIEPALYPSRTQLLLGWMVVPLTLVALLAAGLLVYGALSFAWTVWTRAGGLALAGAALLVLLVPAILYCSGSIPVLHVGADGLLIAVRGAGRFIPYGDIHRFARYQIGNDRSFGLELYLATGDPPRIRLDLGITDRMDAIERAIQDGIDRSHRGRAPADTALLARGDRPVPAWIQSLRAIGSGANATHRTAPVPPERLWRVVEDPHAAPDARAAAAVALAALDSDRTDARKRLLAAARTAVAPQLRIAIEAAADDQHDTLVDALAAVEAEAQHPPDPARARARAP